MKHASFHHSSHHARQAGEKLQPGTGDFIGISPAVQELRREMHYIASDPLGNNVLITGERGTGKDLAANILHNLSVVVKNRSVFKHQDGGLLTPEHAESQLFGHVKGAYTGAHESRMGSFRVAHGGTLFINEIANIPMNIQSMLLRALEYKVIVPMGSDEEVDIDALMIFATNSDLKMLCASGLFRKDLLDRMCCHHLHIPPLRDRREDIVPLIDFLFGKKCRELNLNPVPPIEPRVYELLSGLDLEGNVRQLDNMIKRAFTLMLKEKSNKLTVRMLQAEKDLLAHGLAPVISDAVCPKDAFMQHLAALVTREMMQWKGYNSRQVPCLFDIMQFINELMQLMLQITGNNKSLSARLLNLSRRKFYH